MELFPAEIKDKMPRIGHFDDAQNITDAYVTLKLFNPIGSGTWYVCEANFDEEDMPAYGYVTGLGDDELGFFSLKELQEVRLKHGLPIERDVSWNPLTPLRDVMDRKKT